MFAQQPDRNIRRSSCSSSRLGRRLCLHLHSFIHSFIHILEGVGQLKNKIVYTYVRTTYIHTYTRETVSWKNFCFHTYIRTYIHIVHTYIHKSSHSMFLHSLQLNSYLHACIHSLAPRSIIIDDICDHRW